MDQGRFMFVVTIPPRFERDLRAGRNPEIQVNIDATAMQQAGIGSNYIKNILTDRVDTFLTRTDVRQPQPLDLVVRKLFNPNGVSSWFPSIVAIINQLTLLTDRAHGGRGHPGARARDARAPPGHAA